MRKVVRHYSTCRTGSSNPVTDIAAGVAVGFSRHATKASAQHAAAVLQFSNTQCHFQRTENLQARSKHTILICGFTPCD
jgi:hypothetical protein